MPIIDSTSSKKFYTRKQDETIVSMLKEGKSVDEISAACDHSPASVQYRIQRVLRNPAFNTLDDITYKGAAKVAAVASTKDEVKK